jgi:hypothetical protein
VLTNRVPHRPLQGVPVCVVLLLMVGVTTPTAFAQDRTVPLGDTSGPSVAPSGLLAEPSFITKAINRADRELNQGGEPKDGFYPELGNMITGSGWISAGPGYRHHLLNGRAIVNVSSAVSWNLYKMAQARVELPHLAKDHLTVACPSSRWPTRRARIPSAAGGSASPTPHSRIVIHGRGNRTRLWARHRIKDSS